MPTSGNKKEANHSVLQGWPLVARHYPGLQKIPEKPKRAWFSFSCIWRISRFMTLEAFWCDLRRTLNPAFVGDGVFVPQDDDAGLPELGFGEFDLGEAHNGEAITRFSQVGRRPVEDNLARSSFARDHVGFEPGGVRQ